MSVLLGLLVLGVVVLPLVLGSRLPASHDVEGRSRVRAEPATVDAALADIPGWSSWMPGYGPIRAVAPRNGHPVYESRADERTFLYFELVEHRPPSHVRVQLDSSNGRLSATWDFDVVPCAGGSVVRLRERARTNSPMLRFVMRYVTGQDIGIRGTLMALEQRFGRLGN